MAVFVDLGDDEPDPTPRTFTGLSGWLHSDPARAIVAGPASGSATHFRDSNPDADADADADTPGPGPGPGGTNANADNLAAGAFACYPVVAAIASSIDLNTLDSLSRTCRSAHNSLVSHRSVLMKKALRCTYDEMSVDPEDTLRYRARAGNWHYMEDMGRLAPKGPGKSGSCARDMVSECRRCGIVVCRNCAIKPPAPLALKGRHRRLCRPCTQAPLASLASPPLPYGIRLDSPMMATAICNCPSGVWLCQPCGRSIRTADDQYFTIWKWRNQWGEVLGGVGTGIGDGDRGVTCGRDGQCHGARAQEHEIDCEAEDMRWEFDQQSQNGPETTSGSQSPDPPLFHDDIQDASSPSTTESSPPRTREGSPPLGPGYSRHEIVGIGGVVKKKLLKMVRVGACVPEWEDEKAKGIIMGKERDGISRSWCGWCCRVIPSAKDIDEEKGEEKERIL